MLIKNHQQKTKNRYLTLQNKLITLDKQTVLYKDLGLVDYKTAWDYQEMLFQQNVGIKSLLRKKELLNTLKLY